MYRFQHRMRPRKLIIYPTGGPEARLKRLRQIITGLIRYERIEPAYAQADEARQYAERLIYLAIKNGDKHKPTMEAADYWIMEKDLIPKLFQVLAPRYQNYQTSYTNLHKLAVEYPGHGSARGVLELRGNPWPPVVPKQRDTKYLLSNVLLSGAKKDYYMERRQQQQQAPSQESEDVSSTTSSSSSPSSDQGNSQSVSEEPLSSSVDPKEFDDRVR